MFFGEILQRAHPLFSLGIVFSAVLGPSAADARAMLGGNLLWWMP